MQKNQQFAQICIINIRRRRHSSSALVDDACDLSVGKSLLNVDQRWKRGRRTTALGAMTGRTLAEVHRLARTSPLSIECQATRPRYIVRVDIDNAATRIDCGSTPLRAAIKSGQYYRLFINGKRYEKAIAAKGLELFQCPCVCFRSPLRQHLRSQ